jgi:hypothetical protein
MHPTIREEYIWCIYVYTHAHTHAYIHTYARTHQTERSDVIGTATAGSTISEHSSIPRGISHLPRSSGIPFFHSGRLLLRPRPCWGKRDISYLPACAPRATPRFQSKALPMRVKLAYFFSKGCPRRLFYSDIRSSVSSSTFTKCSVNNTEAFFPASDTNR